MNDELSLAAGIIAMVVGFGIHAVRTWRSQSLVEQLQEATDQAFAQRNALVASFRATKPPVPAAPSPMTTRHLGGMLYGRPVDDDVFVRHMVSTGRDNYGAVIESVSLNLGPRYKPVCEWCATDLKLDSHGVCAGCGARP